MEEKGFFFFLGGVGGGLLLDNSLAHTKTSSCTINLTLLSTFIRKYNGVIHVWNAGY